MEELLLSYSLYLNSIASSASTKKNYVSDARSFFQWLIGYLEEKDIVFRTTPRELVFFIDSQTIDGYIVFLTRGSSSSFTVSRKIAGLKKFFYFAYQGGMLEYLPDISLPPETKTQKTIDIKKIMANFDDYLIDRGMNVDTRKNYLSDISQFIERMETSKDSSMNNI